MWFGSLGSPGFMRQKSGGDVGGHSTERMGYSVEVTGAGWQDPGVEKTGGGHRIWKFWLEWQGEGCLMGVEGRGAREWLVYGGCGIDGAPAGPQGLRMMGPGEGGDRESSRV